MVKKPEILLPGDPIGIVAPGGRFKPEAFKAGIEHIKALGYKPVLGRNVFKKDFLYTGTVDERLDDLYGMLSRKDLKAIWCVRGGYGVYAVAEELAKKPIPRHPKVVLGMSDVTSIFNLIIQKWHWPCLYAPLIDRLIRSPEKEKRVLKSTLGDGDFRLDIASGLSSMGRRRTVTAPMVGGNLALLTTSLGTRWEIQPRGKILFIEDIGERAYRLDRMFWQLKTAGKLDGLKGVVLGDFTECQEPDGKHLWKESLRRVFEKAPYPVVSGVHSGHGALRLTLPLGTKIKITAAGKKSQFSVLESYGLS